ncbi:tyrosine-type recombinase/integrase [Enterococcus dongliensis]|uniref:Tyrosine-type recombinase/integrase n=1 Tax=Enterococcus dongliensis TaxID=2559925 RepID=A0ABU3ERS2_9ENTE|nr:tyrosine-type recombinase/integrase [Enterococcus dongliensis]MDT2597555.1 tyrosine-type recombinase/integrase [Enterococcus dongliensis]
MDWNEIILEFCLDITIKGFSQITIKNYESKLKNSAFYFTEQGVEPLNINKSSINGWILHQQYLKHQSSSINVAVSRMKKLFDYIIDEGHLDINPFTKVSRLPERIKEIHPLNDSEIKNIIDVARRHPYKHVGQRNVVILMIMLDCGLRVSEVTNLELRDVLTNQLIVRNSKNNKDRSVVISPMLQKELIKYERIKKKKYGNMYGNHTFSPLLISSRGGRLNSKTIWQIMSEIKKSACIRDIVRFSGHTLRHTYASMQLRNGLDIYTLSLNLGHSSIQMTQNYVRTLKTEDFFDKSLKTSTLMNLK